MVLLSGSFGGDMRLVAVMQYLRVVVVAVTASVVGRLSGLGGHGSQHAAWLVPGSFSSFAAGPSAFASPARRSATPDAPSPRLSGPSG